MMKSIFSKIFPKRYRYVIYLFMVAAAGCFLLYIAGGVYREFLRGQLMLAGLSVILGVCLSNFTEKHFSGPAERFLNIMTGYGFKDKDAEYAADGVPVVSLRRLMKKYYNPVSVANAGISYYDNWQKNRGKNQFQFFLNCADSLVSNLKIRDAGPNKFGVWEHGYPWSYNLTPPWISALAQGFGIQLLGRAFSATGDPKYKDAAELALEAFFVDVSAGGVTYKDRENEWWYEEYVGKGAVPVRVLNGMMYALLSLDEYGRGSGSDKAKDLFVKGLASLKKNLSSFDAGWWSCYDNLGLVATRHYHAVHLDLLKKLSEKTNDRYLAEIYQKWLGYRKPFFIREFVMQRPSWHDLAILMLNAGIIFLCLEIIFLAMKIKP